MGVIQAKLFYSYNKVLFMSLFMSNCIFTLVILLNLEIALKLALILFWFIFVIMILFLFVSFDLKAEINVAWFLVYLHALINIIFSLVTVYIFALVCKPVIGSRGGKWLQSWPVWLFIVFCYFMRNSTCVAHPPRGTGLMSSKSGLCCTSQPAGVPRGLGC